MKNLKKFLGLLVALVLAVSCTVVPALAAGSVSVSAEKKTAEPGDTVAVAVSVSEATFAGYSMKLAYDADALTLVSVEKNDANNPGLFSANTEVGNAKFGTVSMVSDTDAAISGTLFTVTFKVAEDAAPGTYAVALEDVSCADADRERLSVTVSDGSITVPAPHVHSYTDTVYPPTCTDKGYTLHTCACGDSYKDTWVPEKGHTFTEPDFQWKKDHAACKAVYSCSVCNKPFSADCEVTSKKTDTHTVYTATVVIGGQTYTDTVSVRIPAPATADHSNAGICMIAAMAALAAAGALVVLKKKSAQQ